MSNSKVPAYEKADYYTANYVERADIIDLEKGIDPPTKEARLLAQALVNLFPGYWAYPSTNSRHEGISYYLNAVYDAEKIIEEVERLKNDSNHRG